jgi:hypothetical protein
MRPRRLARAAALLFVVLAVASVGWLLRDPVPVFERFTGALVRVDTLEDARDPATDRRAGRHDAPTALPRARRP